jgi:putative heme-binding domain-containing protein
MLLEAPDPALRETALWVAARHPEWSADILALAGERLRPGNDDTALDAALRDVLLAYAHTPGAQELVARLLRADITEARRDLLLGILRDARLDAFPAPWHGAVAALLEDPRDAHRWGALGVIRTRALEGFDDRLTTLANAPDGDPALRIAALAARLARDPALSEGEFALVAAQLPPDRPPALRQPAAEALAKARLTEEQQLRLSRELLPESDALTFNALVDALARGGHPAVGDALVAALQAMPDTAPSLTVERLDTLLADFPPGVRQAAQPVRARAEAAEAQRFARLETLAPRVGTGDVGRGRRLFFSERAACHTCHAIGEEGGRLGPDLTTIGVVRSGLDLLEAVLFPSASQVPGYENYRFELRDPDFGGTRVEEGLIAGEDAAGLLVQTGVDATLRIPRADLVAMTPHTVSKMPADLDATLSEEELLDLIAFLQSLNNEVWLLPGQRDNDH